MNLSKRRRPFAAEPEEDADNRVWREIGTGGKVLILGSRRRVSWQLYGQMMKSIK